MYEDKTKPDHWLTLIAYDHQPFWHLSFKGSGWPGAFFKVFCGDIGPVLKTGAVHEKRINDTYICRECKSRYFETRNTRMIERVVYQPFWQFAFDWLEEEVLGKVRHLNLVSDIPDRDEKVL